MSPRPQKPAPSTQPTHPELAAQPGETVPRDQQDPKEAERRDRQAQKHNVDDPKRRAT